MYVSTPEEKQKLGEDVAEAVRVIISTLKQHVLKATRKRKIAIAIFQDMSCSMEKLKTELFSLNVLLEKKRRKTAPSKLYSMGVAASCCAGVLLQKGLVHFTE